MRRQGGLPARSVKVVVLPTWRGPLTKAICDAVNIPVIASGGAGSLQHFSDVLTKTSADAALAASVFHYGEIPIAEVKNYLKEHKVNTRV